jgi:hypothetical protein
MEERNEAIKHINKLLKEPQLNSNTDAGEEETEEFDEPVADEPAEEEPEA